MVEDQIPAPPTGRHLSARDAVVAVCVCVVLLLLFEGASIRRSGEEMQSGWERTLVLSVGRPAGALSDRTGLGGVKDRLVAWAHPDDGPQDGLLVISSAGGDGSLAALWGDSWHQQPVPMSLSAGPAVGETVAFTGEYGDGWGWRIAFDVSDTEMLRMRMDNVIPADHATADIPAGPYPVMVMDVRRT